MKFSNTIIIIAAIVFPTTAVKASILGNSLRGVERQLIKKSTKKGKSNKATKSEKVSKPSGNIDTSSSSGIGDLGSVSDLGTCVPSSGAWGGKSFNGNGSTPFETCYKNGLTGAECWSKSYLIDIGACTDPWRECQPQGYTGDDQGWNFLNSGAATSTCGSPCEKVVTLGPGLP